MSQQDEPRDVKKVARDAAFIVFKKQEQELTQARNEIEQLEIKNSDLLNFIEELGPSWLPEGIRDRRRAILAKADEKAGR